MANNNIQLSGASLQIIDSNASVTRVNSAIATLIAQAGASLYDAYLTVGTSPLAVTLPAATCFNLYVRNISGSATVNVTLTPAGGSAWVSPLVLYPTAAVIYLGTYSSNPTAGGYTALTLQASAASTNVELLAA